MSFERPSGADRLAYRDVASSTNRLTLIAAIVPPGAVTVHTLFCLRNVMPVDDQVVLCCLLNSFVANYLVRLWVTTHLGTATVERLPVPRPSATSRAATRLRDLGRELLESGGHKPGAYAEVQGLAASLYGLSLTNSPSFSSRFPSSTPAPGKRQRTATAVWRRGPGGYRLSRDGSITGSREYSSDGRLP